MKFILSCVFSLISILCFSQQEEFKNVINFYNQHRNVLTSEFEKKFNEETNTFSRALIRQDFVIYMKKMDSVENITLIGALLKVKIREDLKKISQRNNRDNTINDLAKAISVQKVADYPGGIDELRKKVSDLFYIPGVYSEVKNLKTDVDFIVEKDGSISNVKAKGENFTFNRQAEIALYSIPEKFSPAIANGKSVRYYFNLPLTMSIDK